MLFLVSAYTLNVLSPTLAGKFQVSTTIIKLIPLGLMAVVGKIYGLIYGITQENFMNKAIINETTLSNFPLFAAVCATAFAYEGWIIATSINAELKDAKRNLPKALIIGGVIVIITYITYFVGVAGGANNQDLIETGATIAFTNIFGNIFGNILNLFIAISCMGTCNGLTLGVSRGMYSLAIRNQGIQPNIFKQVDAHTKIPTNSAVIGLLFSAIWGFYFYCAQLSAAGSSWLGPFVFDSSELPIITIYGMYIPIFFM